MTTSARPGRPFLSRRKRTAPLEGSGTRGTTTALPRELQADAARRLRAVALLYAFVFFVEGPLSAAVQPDDRRTYFSDALHWAPPLVSIAVALTVAFLTRVEHGAQQAMLKAGLWFQVVGSYGIAAAQYLDTQSYLTSPPWAGLSWVAVWMLSYAIMIPSRPARALAAALGSASAVPVVTLLALASSAVPVNIPPVDFTLRVVLPYLLVVVIAYVGANVVYRLGAELTRARELGGYRLVELVGHGGMGEVWRAEHRLLARPAAIKLIRPDTVAAPGGSAAELRARFAQEAQATSALRSPHTIELYDFGMADDGTFFYVMELLDGFDLQVLVERFGPIPVARAVHLMTQVCHSLAEAHDRGLVHRDIKPANVYVCRYGRDVDFVKVLDFGLVKPVHREQRQTGLALTGAPLAHGTPAFMAPEQAVGNRPIDGRSDLYALGCLGYWLVTGQHVFQGDSPVETIIHHLQTPPEPPSRRAGQAIPPAFDEIVLSCLDKDPGRRPSGADEVRARLRAIPLEAEWSQEDARRWWNARVPDATEAARRVGLDATDETLPERGAEEPTLLLVSMHGRDPRFEGRAP